MKVTQRKQIFRRAPLMCLLLLCTSHMFAGSEKVLFVFLAAQNDSNHNPQGTLIFDSAGNIYGGAGTGLDVGGVVYELTPSGGNWAENILYTFRGPVAPDNGVIFDAAGNLYGTSLYKTVRNDHNGLVFELTPNGAGGWSESIIHAFSGPGGAFPNSLVLTHRGTFTERRI